MWTRFRTSTPVATQVLIVLNVAVFVLQIATGGDLQGVGGSDVLRNGALFGPSIDVDNEWYRLVTSGFLHAGLIHLGLNMLALWWLGGMLEPRFGSARFVAVYVVSLLAGSLGALLVDPLAVTVGASGAVYGLLGAGIVIFRRLGVPWQQNGLVTLLVLNLLLTLAIPGISFGGHVGGLLGGVICGFLVTDAQGRPRQPVAIGLMGAAGIAMLVVVGSLAAAGTWIDRI